MIGGSFGDRLAEQLVGGRGDQFSLVACALQFDRAGAALALAAGNRGRAIGAAADDFRERHLTLMTVGQADYRHAEVQEIGDDRKKRRFLAAMLRRRAREGTTDFAVERAPKPQAAGLVEE